MSGKKQKLLRKYLKKRNATDKVYLTKSVNGKINKHSISKDIISSYTTANSKDKRVLTKFFNNILNETNKK